MNNCMTSTVTHAAPAVIPWAWLYSGRPVNNPCLHHTCGGWAAIRNGSGWKARDSALCKCYSHLVAISPFPLKPDTGPFALLQAIIRNPFWLLGCWSPNHINYSPLCYQWTSVKWNDILVAAKPFTDCTETEFCIHCEDRGRKPTESRLKRQINPFKIWIHNQYQKIIALDGKF
jgi:hypothetical protein